MLDKKSNIDILLNSKLELGVLNHQKIETAIQAEEQNKIITEQLKLLEKLYENPNLEFGMQSAISETYFQYFKRARHLYVVFLNIGLNDSDVNQDILSYDISDDTLTLNIIGMFNDDLVKDFLQPIILETIFGLGFENLMVLNPKNRFKKNYSEKDWLQIKNN